MLKVWELEHGYERESCLDLELWETTFKATRLSSHYDPLDEKWYFYERVHYPDGRIAIYQLSTVES